MWPRPIEKRYALTRRNSSSLVFQVYHEPSLGPRLLRRGHHHQRFSRLQDTPDGGIPEVGVYQGDRNDAHAYRAGHVEQAADGWPHRQALPEDRRVILLILICFE